MTEPPAHGWLLTAPWWHWPRQDVPPAFTRPALQKYASPDLVNDFLAEPQRRLVFDPLADHTQAPPFDPATLLPVPETADAPTDDGLTKVYLPTHHRHYLVTVELHCDALGLPSPSRTDVCEAGFVVRRRTVRLSAELVAEARGRVRGVSLARARLGAVERRLTAAARGGRIGAARFDALASTRASAQRALAARQAEVREWASSVGLARSLEGWVPLAVDGETVVPLPERPDRRLRPLPHLGRWVPVAELPDTLGEATFPLYPLVPDPADPEHDGTGRAIWFGVMPTGGLDAQYLGGTGTNRPEIDRAPRFDDLSVYEIRCFVRRHDPACPRREGRRDCHGPLTWSEPSEAYRLAGPLDARGTAHRPVTVRLPSRAELGEAAALGPGIGGMRVASPDITLDPGGDGTGFQICSFGIPLITIVATFVLRLFLPIVVFLFGLWILLALKLCIPPSISLSGGAQAAVDAKPPGFEADAAFEASLEADFGVDVPAELSGAGSSLTSGFGKSGLTPTPPPDLGGGLSGSTTPAERFRLLRALSTRRLTAPDDELLWEKRVERTEVFVP